MKANLRCPALLAAFALLFCISCARAETPVLALWPGAAPGETNTLGEEKDMTKATDNSIAGKPVIRLGNVSKPSLTVYVGSSRVDLQACKLEYSIVSPK